MTSRERLGLFLGTLGVVIFGATLPMTRLAVGFMEAWFVTFGRAAVAGLCAVILMAILRKVPPPRAEWPRYALVAFCLTIGFPGCVALAMVTVPAAQGGVVLGIMPLATAAASALLTGERPSLAFWLCGFLGAALVVAFVVVKAGGWVFTQGDLFLGLAIVAAAIGYTLSGQLAGGRPGFEVISWVMVLALPITVPMSLVYLPMPLEAVPAKAWGAFLYLALFSQFIGFFFWNTGLAMGGIARVSQTQLLQTFITLGVAALALGEVIDLSAIVFAVTVVAVVAIGTRFKAR